MSITTFSGAYLFFNDIASNGIKSLLSEMLLDSLDLSIVNESLLSYDLPNDDETLRILGVAFNDTKQKQQIGEADAVFTHYDFCSAWYAISRSFDARVSHHPSSCDYFILYEQLRKASLALRDAAPAAKTIDEAARDVTQFDELLVMPALRLAVSFMRPSQEKDALILADLILLCFSSFAEFSRCYHASKSFSSAASIADGTEPIAECIRAIIAFKVHRLAEKKQGTDALVQMLSRLAAIRQTLHDSLAALTDKNRDHSLTVEKIIAGKSAMAYGYHHKKKLNQCPFDELMKNDPREFTRQLKKSNWFKGKTPERMAFFNRLTTFEGPMYKVFNEHDLATMKRWAMTEQAEPDAVAEDKPSPSLILSLTLPQYAQQYREETNIRELFHQLMTSNDHFYLDWQSKKFTDAWLARARKKLRHMPFKNYSPASLDEWFLSRTKMQMDDYAQGKMVSSKSREEVIDEAVHLAPMILLDGAWINHYSYPQLISDNIGEILFEIYADEIGNGFIEKNHPIIYRDLISDMGIELPDIASRAFSASEYFDDDDFLVPVFWLSVSRFPQKYLPETLGLNLAMELSGVGGAYNQAHDELKQYGFNTLFVDLHNSIDNASSGHSAGALNAIKIYMSRFANSSNPKLTRLLWERVWTGYISLAPSKSSLLFPSLAKKYHI